MNLCLSGLAGCYAKVHYPAVLQEATVRIRQAQPNVVTFNEACSGDVALIARRTGYHVRFSGVIYYGKPFRCIKPGGRGVFGDAVLTGAAVQSSDSGAFEAQAGPERRGWLCVGTRGGIDVCTAHLASPAPEEAAANAPQCRERFGAPREVIRPSSYCELDQAAGMVRPMAAALPSSPGRLQ
jgi:endonuclease/exonuclease/phosphatase family metal-dependent hydrolase